MPGFTYNFGAGYPAKYEFVSQTTASTSPEPTRMEQARIRLGRAVRRGASVEVIADFKGANEAEIRQAVRDVMQDMPRYHEATASGFDVSPADSGPYKSSWVTRDGHTTETEVALAFKAGSTRVSILLQRSGESSLNDGEYIQEATTTARELVTFVNSRIIDIQKESSTPGL